MLKKPLIAAIILSSSLAFVGCQSTPSTPAKNQLDLLQNTTWLATKIADSVLVDHHDLGHQASLKFDQSNRVTGTDSCNRLMGSYQADHTSIRLDQLSTTRMACLNNNNLDQKFNQALSQVTAYQVKGKHLKLYDAKGHVILEFKASKAKAQP